MSNCEANGLADGATMLKNTILPNSSCRLPLSCREPDVEPRTEASLLYQGLPFRTVGLSARTEQFIDRQVGEFMAEDLGNKTAVRWAQ